MAELLGLEGAKVVVANRNAERGEQTVRHIREAGGEASYVSTDLSKEADCVGLVQRTVDTYMIAICNGRYFGSGMHVAPMAAADDGRFEVVSLDAPSKLAFATFSRRIYEGKHLSSPGVQHFACDRIAIDLENESARGVFLLDVDGEPLGGLPLEVELVPKALTLRA